MGAIIRLNFSVGVEKTFLVVDMEKKQRIKLKSNHQIKKNRCKKKR